MPTTHQERRARLWKLLALVLAMAMVAAACGGDDDGGGGGEDAGATTTPTTEEDAGEPQPGGSITVGLEAETNGWSPHQGNWASSGYVVAHSIYDPLMSRTEDGEIEPYLAESLTPNDDLTEWTLKLREGITFHDGTPLTAQVIADNVALLKEPGSITAATASQISEFRVEDELTGVYVLAQSNAAFPDLLVGAVGMPWSMENFNALGPDEAASNPVGTGPFVFQSWTRDDKLTVQKNPNYWRDGLPYLDSVTFRPIPDEDTRLASLRSGDVDVMHTLRQSIVAQARDAADGGDIKIFEFVGNEGGGAIFNTLVPPVDDARVRKGLAHGIDQDALIEVLGGTGISPPQTQYFSPDSPWYSEDVAEAWPKFDEEQARELLDEYINDENRSDGKNPGDPIAVEFNCPPDPSLIELSQAYQAYWGNLGVDVTLNQVEQATHIQNAIGSPDSDPPFKGDFMINCWRMGGQADPYVQLSVSATSFGPVESSPVNFTNYTSESINENLETLRTSDDFDTRYEAVESIMMELTEQVPLLWTGSTATLVGTAPNVNGIASWTLPDGAAGVGVESAVMRLVQTWVG